MRSVVSLLLVAFVALLGSGASAEPVGFFAALKGEVQVSTGAAAGGWLAARQDGPLEVGDRIRTAPGASARIVLVDDTLLHVDEDTEFRIESFHVGSAATRERSVVRQTRGRLRTVVGDAFGGSTRIEIHTPTAVAGVKGTDLETADDSLPGRPRYRMCCHEGAITVSNGRGSAAPPPGQCVHVEPGRAPGAPFPNPEPPFEAAGDADVDEDDFREEAQVQLPPDAGPDPRDEGDLRRFDLPEAQQQRGQGPITSPGFVAGPPIP